MSTALTGLIVFACLFGAAVFGMRLRSWLPDHHLGTDTKDTVKMGMGLVATMSALLLGLLVASAKGSYDTQRTQVIQMAAKIAFLDRVLTAYGPEATEVRAQLRTVVDGVIASMWPQLNRAAAPAHSDTQAGDAVYGAVQRLSAATEVQRGVKAQAAAAVVDLGQLRTLMLAQSLPSVSQPLLVVVVCWLVIIFLSFGLFAPTNLTVTLALMLSALSVSGAIFLILELDRPFGGLIHIPAEVMLQALRPLTH